jgi:hypothetical protein
VNVDHVSAPFAKEGGGEKSHIARKNHQFNVIFQKSIQNFLFMLLTREGFPHGLVFDDHSW